jgi:hypothetical protein
MKAADYLEQLRRQLQGFSPREQADILDEITSHIESGQDDPSVGEERVMAELGTPEQMQHELRSVHRPNRKVDLLLVLVPYLVISRSIQILLNIFFGPLKDWSVADPHLYLGGRIAILLAVLLALVGFRRRSAPLVIFWLWDGIGTLVSLMMREARFIPGKELIPGSVLESILFYVVLFGLVFWLVKTLKKNRFDSLLVVFVLLPLMLMAANFSTLQLLSQSGISPRPLALPFGLAGILGYRLVWALGVSLFFLFQSRDVRWTGLLLVGVNYIYPSVIFYRSSIPILLMWLAIVALVPAIWVLDVRNRSIPAGNRPPSRWFDW